MDDRLFHDPARPFLVASLDLRLVDYWLGAGDLRSDPSALSNLVWIGYGIVGPFLVANARPGAIFHITFPAVARTV